MRILVVSSTFTPLSNGQAIFTANLVEQLAKTEHEVMALVPSDQGKSYHTIRNGAKIQYLRTVNSSWVYPGSFYTPFPYATISSVLDTFKPDIIHIQDHYPLGYYVYFAAHKRKIKVVGTNHFMPENLAPIVPWASWAGRGFNWLLWRWMMLLYNRFNGAAAPSHTAVRILHENGIRVPTTAVSCGVSLQRFHPDDSIDRLEWRKKYNMHPNKKIFFFIGRVDGEKRLDVLIHALHQLKRDDIQLVIAGKGYYAQRLQDMAQELSLGNIVHFTGYIPNEDLPALLNCVDIFCMPSEAELLSIASLEAMASGKPLLVANSQALPELVSYGENGYLFKPGDVGDAARHIALLADHPEEWTRMGKASLIRVQNHSLENMVRSYIQFYEKILSTS